MNIWLQSYKLFFIKHSIGNKITHIIHLPHKCVLHVTKKKYNFETRNIIYNILGEIWKQVVL